RWWLRGFARLRKWSARWGDDWGGFGWDVWSADGPINTNRLPTCCSHADSRLFSEPVEPLYERRFDDIRHINVSATGRVLGDHAVLVFGTGREVVDYHETGGCRHILQVRPRAARG